MGLQEIDNILDHAEKTADRVVENSFRYSRALDGYMHSKQGETPEELGEVSPRDIYRETYVFVNSIESHEEMIETLDQTARELERMSDQKVSPGDDISKSSLESRFEDVYSRYMENLVHARDVAHRGEKVEEVPSPIYMKSDIKKDSEPFQDNLDMIEVLE